ncbi:CLUMA_CG003628, isoform A [Clunio marinus]|uniref:Elongation factor Ts, mitochondrial n=1 Tax=Clunio marinus TaxID=568069 RepID=A0A1J1HPB4_9DIPT|nr:CLUMA_CG003628, isoform A [Clunio marinus]
MYYKQFTRFFHVTRSVWGSTDKSALSALRKKTGYTFANCKKALELHENDLTKAEQWLKEQAQALGWSKATKLEGRATTQGLIGVLVQQHIGAMVEVNCETDFVARNENFQEFVGKASKACAHYISEVDNVNKITKIGLEGETLRNLKLEDGKTLNDHLALLIGTVGENASLKRAICYKSPESVRLSGYIHPTPDTPIEEGLLMLGKYGSIAAFNSNSEKTEEILNIHRKICQHIVGMNPLKIGDIEVDKPNEVKDEETCLIHQEFLLDPEVTIGQMLQEHNIKIIDFQRFECGEKIEYHEASQAAESS